MWFNGGRQWNIVDSYAGTRTYDEFHRVLERGGVVAGSSAGATILGEYLVRGDTRGPQIVMTKVFLPYPTLQRLRPGGCDGRLERPVGILNSSRLAIPTFSI